MRGFSGAVWSVSSELFPGRVIQTCHDYENMSPDGLLRGSIGKMALQKQVSRAWLSTGSFKIVGRNFDGHCSK